MNGYYPYGENGGYYPPPKKTLSEKIRDAFADEGIRGLMLLGGLAGGGLILYQIMSRVYVSLTLNVPGFYELYEADKTVQYLAETMYSFFCVAMPFALVYPVMKKTGVAEDRLPLSIHADGSHPVLLILAGLGVCYVGNIISSYLIQILTSFGIGSFAYETAMAEQTDIPESIPVLIVTVLHTAVVPALTEEFVFRGVIMQPLRKYGDWFAIVTSAVVFGLVHGNVMQIPFAILAGIALGYAVTVTGSMWVGIALHLLNNLLSVLFSMLLSAAEGGAQTVVSLVYTYGMIAVGAAAFMIYVLKNRDFIRLYPCQYPGLKGKARLYFLMPTMAVAILLILLAVFRDLKF